MKPYYLFLIFTAITAFGCNNCRNNDCGGDDTISISVVSDDEIDYSDSIDFYYFDQNQQKVEASIEPNRPGSQIYYAFLDYQKPGTQSSYYIEVGNQVDTVVVQTRYDEDPCCGDYLRFEAVTMNGKITSLPISIVID